MRARVAGVAFRTKADPICAAEMRALDPLAASDTSSEALLVEGPLDMLAARCQGLSAFAVPAITHGNQGWAAGGPVRDDRDGRRWR